MEPLCKGGLISEDILNLVPNHAPEQKIVVYYFGQEIQISAQGHDLAPFVGNGTKVKIPSEINPPLRFRYLFFFRSVLLPYNRKISFQVVMR